MLTIRGQGFSKLTAVFQNSLSGLGQRDRTTYAQVFLGTYRSRMFVEAHALSVRSRG